MCLPILLFVNIGNGRGIGHLSSIEIISKCQLETFYYMYFMSAPAATNL